MSRNISAAQRTRQATDHKMYGCSYVQTLTQGERLCSVCGSKAYCPYCTRHYPLNATLVACTTHKDLDR